MADEKKWSELTTRQKIQRSAGIGLKKLGNAAIPDLARDIESGYDKFSRWRKKKKKKKKKK